MLAPPVIAGKASRVKVLSIDPYGSKDRARVVVTLSGATSYRAGDLAGPRLFLDLERTEPSSRREIAVAGLVERVRQAKRADAADEEITRIVLDLAAPRAPPHLLPARTVPRGHRLGDARSAARHHASRIAAAGGARCDRRRSRRV